jgi:ribonuclease R
MNSETIAQQILTFVYSQDYRPAKPRVIHKALKLSEDEYRDLRRAIKKLIREGRLTFGKNHLVLKPTSPITSDSPPSRSNDPDEDVELVPEAESLDIPKSKRSSRSPELVGIFRVAPNRQFGFVKLPRVAGELPDDEVFIPPRDTKNAMEGDTVKIRISTRSDERTVGKVVEIVARGRREFSGTFQRIENQAMVWLDGANLSHPVQIGDVRGLPVEENDKVIVELVRFPDFFQPGEAVILRVLGSNKNPAVDTMAVMHQYGLAEEFPEAAIEVARHQADLFDETVIPEGRSDLTAIPTVTIDPFDARDFDDAISLTKNEKGNWELQVHIADVSHFVPPGSALDVEAQRRATSVYLPDRVVPMIPEIISNHLASLQPDRNRLAKTVFLEYTPEGTLLHKRVFNSVIRNHFRFNYEQIDQYLADRESWRDKLKPEIFQLVAHMHELAMMLRRKRSEAGALELVLPEVKIDLDKVCKVKGAHLVHHTESHQVIEEFMLAANEAVAAWLDELELPFLRRAHAPPNRLKLRQLNQFVRSLGVPAEDLENRFEIQRVVNEVRGKPTEYAVNYAILKSMSKAIYQAGFERHYALNISHYCHFTSPIRRYPDFVVHRIIQKLITGQPAKENEQILERLGEHCSAMEQNAEAAERELIRVKLLHFLSKRKGELMSGIVAGVKPTGLTIRAIEIPIDGMIRVEDLPSDRYRFDRDTHSLEGFRSGNRYRLGDEVLVRVNTIDIVQRQLNFQLEKVTRSLKVAPLGPIRPDRPDRKPRSRKSSPKGKRRR